MKTEGITRMQTIVTAVIVIVIVTAAVYYLTLPTPTSTPTPTITPTPTPTSTPTPTITPTPTPTLPDYYPADYWKIIDASKKEGGLLVYGVSGTTRWEPVLEEFNKLYPWINVETLDLGSYEVFERYYAEVAGGAKTTDFIQTVAPDAVMEFQEKGEALYYVSPEQKFYPKWSYMEGQFYTITVDPMIIAYNPKLIPPEKVPKGIADLARLVEEDPEFWKGKLCTYHPETSGTGFNNWFAFASKYGEDAWKWFASIAKARPAYYASTGPMVEKMIAGEHALSFFNSPGTVKRAAEENPEYLKWFYAEDGTIMRPRAIMIPKASSSPNSAKLLLDFCLSRKGQIAWGSYGGYHPLRLDLEPGSTHWGTYSEIVAEVGEDNVILYDYWNPDIRDPAKRKAFLDRWYEVMKPE